MKTCFACGRVLPLKDFYRHPQMGDGHLGKCKECTRAHVRANRELKRDHYQEYDRRRFQTPKRKTQMAEYQRVGRKVNKDKYAARRVVLYAIRTGKVDRQPCEVCGDPKSQAHHADYSKPLDVQWLCFRHHREAHGQMPSAAPRQKRVDQ